MKIVNSDPDLNRIRSHFKQDQNWIYSENPKPEWLINRVIAICKYRPSSTGLISDFAEQDTQSVQVWVDNIGYCGDEIGPFDYCQDLSVNLESLEYAQVAATQIWELSEKLNIPLGRYASVVFWQMINRNGVKVS